MCSMANDADNGSDCTSDIDGGFDDEPMMALYRQKRLSELRAIQSNLMEVSDGRVTDCLNDSEFLHLTTSNPLVIMHYYHEQYQRCSILDGHLANLARKFPRVKWCRINVLNGPFVVNKLHVQVLPCLDVFINGIKSDRLVGFEELGNTDNFSTLTLEARLAKSGIFKTVFKNPLRQGNRKDDDDDDDNSE